MTKPTSLHELYALAVSRHGCPYIWGGEGPDTFDCSGFIRWLLKPLRMVPSNYDQRAQDLSAWFLGNGGKIVDSGRLGALAFFGGDGDIEHVGLCIDNLLMIHAGGGNASVKSIAQAEKTGAKVKVEPIRYRRDFLHFVMPNYRF